MTTIEAGKGIITQINVFSVDPKNVDALVETLKEAAHTVKGKNGWLSINLHVSLDRTKVTNYAQCSSKEAWDEIMEDLYSNGFIDRLVALGSPEPCLYEVAWTLSQ
jgi:quinol monooxygenase YgiN